MEAEPAAAVEASRESGGDAARAKEEVGAANRSDEARQPTIDADLRRRVFATLRDQDDDNVLLGKIIFEPNLPLVGLKARLIASKLSNVGAIRYFDPPLDDVENREEIDAIAFGLVTDRSPEAVRRLLHVAGVQQTAIEPLDRRRRRPDTAQGNAGPAEPGAKPAETLRVDIERLDRLMNLAGQLAIGKARVTQIGDRLKKAVAGGNMVHAFDRVVAELKKMGKATPPPCTAPTAMRKWKISATRRGGWSLAWRPCSAKWNRLPRPALRQRPLGNDSPPG